MSQTHRNGPINLHYHNAIKSTNASAIYTPTTNIVTEPLTDKYIVGENIGRGKFAVVRKCTHKQTNEVVAAKFIKKRRRGKSCREEILREVVMLEMALDHPRLVNLKEVYETQQELILITEYCAGGELFTECILEEKFNESDVRLLMAQILEGLVYLHDKNIVHLDLKPQNILLTDEFPRGSVKICDLGFACLVNTGEDIRDIIGTPDYVAPEVLNYDSLGLYTDMWSLGVLTYVMLTQCSPFAADDKQMTFSNITTVNFQFPEDLFSNISKAAQDFIQKLLIGEPSERMTAKQCFKHEWLLGVFHPRKPLTLCDSDDQEETSDDLSVQRSNSRGVMIENDIGYSEQMMSETSPGNDSDNSDSQTEGWVQSRTNEQSSEMSVEEHKESDSKSEEKLDGTIEQCKSESITNSDQKPGFSSVNEESHKHDEMSSKDITPDTESSGFLSDSKLAESDTGLVTGSEFRIQESFDSSGRTSTEPDFAEEKSNDIEMKDQLSVVSVGSKDLMEETEGHVFADKGQSMEKIVSVVSENNMECNQTDTNQVVTQMNLNNSAKHCGIRVQVPNDVSLDSDSNSRDNFFNSSTLSDSGNSPSLNINIEQQSPIFGSFSDDNKYANTPTPHSGYRPHLNSVGNIDDSINSMQLGERLKRGICNDPNLSGVENPEIDEQEYEFVSVSKRVRSIEESNPPPASPPFSPKIARSPKITRNSRFHPHQHH